MKGGGREMKNYNFYMKTNVSKYLGEWIAIADDEVVSHGKDLKKIYNAAKKKHPQAKVLVAKIPGEKSSIYLGQKKLPKDM